MNCCAKPCRSCLSTLAGPYQQRLGRSDAKCNLTVGCNDARVPATGSMLPNQDPVPIIAKIEHNVAV